MMTPFWTVTVLLLSIIIIVVTIVKYRLHPFLALLLASFFVGTLTGMDPRNMVAAIENGIGGTLGFLAAVIWAGNHPGKNDGDIGGSRTDWPHP
nr:hypothetical protein PJ912_09330 [Pectobacterium colocasium]